MIVPAVRAAIVAAISLSAGCRSRGPACFKIKSIQGAAPSPAGAVLRIFEAFVLANAPGDAEAIRRAVETHCGKQPVPDASAWSVQWWIFKETRDTPRSLQVEAGPQDDLDRHRPDLIADLVHLRTECGDYLTAFFFRDGEQVAKTADHTPPPKDAGPLPAACRKSE